MTTVPDPGVPRTSSSGEATAPHDHGSPASAGSPAPQLAGGTPATEPTSSTGIAIVILAGVAVAVVLGVYGRVHEPTFVAVNLAGFSTPGYAKAWLTTLAFLLAIVQLLSSMVMYGKIAQPAPEWIGGLHRWSGRIAVLLTVPVAVHCLYALGFSYDQPRALVHSLFGCLFYGVFVTKMLVLTRKGMPGWGLPVFGGVVFTLLVGLWMTSALWLFTTQGLSF